ncbi:hypothetical protein [Xylocopilactobacillus apis]|uniref:Uncharacterized protein n=1 Tax=Xylocopilactobacillus apis TaxID=2932183 RepID=A0AAU9CUH6_9LACO|nr:hypothetical protein [Xylocopilactobacillus apis]BDR56031.1 hypothetical protein KIMC2_05930 [Xylocopilactobacillus apis]
MNEEIKKDAAKVMRSNIIILMGSNMFLLFVVYMMSSTKIGAIISLVLIVDSLITMRLTKFTEDKLDQPIKKMNGIVQAILIAMWIFCIAFLGAHSLFVILFVGITVIGSFLFYIKRWI